MYLCFLFYFRPSHSVYPSQRIIPKGNVAAIEPYIHMPHQKPNALTNSKQQKQSIQPNQHHQKLVQDLTNLKLNLHETTNQKNANNTLNTSNSNVNVNHIQYPESDETKLARQILHMKQQSQDFETNVSNDMTDFVVSNKNELKFQTLPYNTATAKASHLYNAKTNTSVTKTTKILSSTTASTTQNLASKESMDIDSTTKYDSSKPQYENEMNGSKLQSHSQMTSSAINESIATSAANAINLTSNTNQRFDEKAQQKSKIATSHQIPSGNLVVPPRKPISSVAPTSITHTTKSILPTPRIHAVAPNISNNNNNSSPIVSASESLDKLRPALPPKPNKSNDTNSSSESSPTSSASSSSLVARNRNTNIPMIVGASEKSMFNADVNQQSLAFHAQNIDNFPIKAKPLTIKKQPLSEQPRLRSHTSGIKPIQYSSRRIEMPPELLFPDIEKVKTKSDDSKMLSDATVNAVENKSPSASSSSSIDDTDKSVNSSVSSEMEKTNATQNGEIVRRQRSALSENGKVKLTRRVSFDPLALLLDASLEGELELVQKTAMQVKMQKTQQKLINNKL